jgi:uroporphyrinogen III methyltransferase/synthase
LSGLSVAVTRARAQASGLARSLAGLGARVVEAPAIRIRALSGPPLDPSGYDLICVTSANGVEGLFERLAACEPPLDARALAGARVAAVGASTAEALLAHGILADVVPQRSVAEGLVEALVAAYGERPARRALLARAAGGREELPDELRERGVEVDVLELYETVAEAPAPGTVEAALGADYITFTSSSTVRYFLEAAGGPGAISAHSRLVSIGPVTSATMREAGIEPHLEAERHDVDGVIAALLADAADKHSAK